MKNVENPPNKMKGIILAGGSGSRLNPITFGISKQLLPVYDKPMIYYPLSVLMLANIKDILIISTPRDLPIIKNLLGNGGNYGINVSYKEQVSPGGIGEAFLLGEDFIGDSPVCLILGDNIFYGQGFTRSIQEAKAYTEEKNESVIFGYHVKDPERYGVAEIDEKNNVLSLEEKPLNPKSQLAVVGLYFFSNNVVEIAKNTERSSRGELEITDINKAFLKSGKLKLKKLGRGLAWLDTGTISSLYEASEYVRAIQERQGLIIACLEEIAYNNGNISYQDLQKLIKNFGETKYRKHLESIISQR